MRTVYVSTILEKRNYEDFLKLKETDDTYTYYKSYSDYIKYLKDFSKDRCEEETELYELVVKNVANYIKTNCINDPVSYCGYLSTLFFKYDLFGNFNYDENTYDEDILGLYGSTLLTGKGCCRHLSSFFNDVLNELGVNSKIYLTHIESGNIDNSYVYEYVFDKAMVNVTRKAEEIDEEAKHLVVGFEYNKVMLAFDPLNLLLFSVINDKLVSLNGNYTYSISPASYMMFDNLEYEEIVSVIMNARKEALSEEEEDTILSLFYKSASSAHKVNHNEFISNLKNDLDDFNNLRNLRINGGSYKLKI